MPRIASPLAPGPVVLSVTFVRLIVEAFAPSSVAPKAIGPDVVILVPWAVITAGPALPFACNPIADRPLVVTEPLDRYANCDGVFVLVCSGSLEANGVKKLFEIVYNLLIEPIQLSTFVVLELGVRPVRLK